MRPRPCTAVLPSRTIAQSGLPVRNRTTQYPLSVQNARTQLADVSVMIDRPRHLDSAPEREAEAIARASDQEVRYYVRRGIMERWLSRVVHCLNRLEGRPGTRDFARRALQRLGFPTPG